MSVLPVGFGAQGSAGFQIDNAVRLDGANDYFSIALAGSATNSGSIWVKKHKNGATTPVFDGKVYFNSSDQLVAFGLTSTAVYRDPMSWYHVFWNGTGVWVNGVAVSGSGTYSQSGTTNPRIGYNGTNYAAISIADFAYYDGVSVSLTGGAVDVTTGSWKATRPTGSPYSYLNFTNTADLGNDVSGNNNDWTRNSIDSTNAVGDTPTNNFAVWNAQEPNPGSVSFSNGNRMVALGSGGSWRSAKSVKLPTSGKWYFEVSLPTASPSYAVGLCTSGTNMSDLIGRSSNGWALYGGTLLYTNSTYTSGHLTGTPANGDVTGIAVDMDAGKVWFRRNGVWGTVSGNVGDPVTGVYPAFSGLPTNDLFPACSGDFGVGWLLNYGQAAFAASPPTGYNTLCTTNLPTPSITDPSKQMDVVLDTGANILTTAQVVFPGNYLVWIKDRVNSNNYQLIDTVRGATAVLQSNTTAAETTYSTPSNNSVAWCWKAGGAAVSNTDGTITSQVSANPTAGFSIVTWTGTGANATVGHGLGAAPDLVIVKGRTNLGGSTMQWDVWHSALAATEYLVLNSSAAKTTGATTVWNSALPSASVFSLGTAAAVNAVNDKFVAYCWTEIEGFSKFGSYTGNGSADGPYIHCGFRPRWLLVKRTDTAIEIWLAIDTKRDAENACDALLCVDLSLAESTGIARLDIDANGFKLRSAAGDVNTSGGAYIFAAFAEYPFGGQNIVPGKAR